jgi:hypothetical protein
VPTVDAATHGSLVLKLGLPVGIGVVETPHEKLAFKNAGSN